jgi:hypothetical protein
MSVTYRISHLMSQMDTTICPPLFLPVMFPQFDGSQPVRFVESGNGFVCEVTFATPQTPVDLGALVKVEIIS